MKLWRWLRFRWYCWKFGLNREQRRWLSGALLVRQGEQNFNQEYPAPWRNHDR